MENIMMIVATDCDDCKAMRQAINTGIRHFKLEGEVNLFVHNCKDDESIEVALEYGITDIPGCSIGGKVIEGEGFDPQEILDALEVFSK
jgi:hypothetical protein